MKLWQRIVLALLILVIDFAVFFVPLSAVFLATVVLFRPQWVEDFLDFLYYGDSQ
jgi:uncharacterized membrane protein YdjX (TVP38/TMEM64 family)